MKKTYILNVKKLNCYRNHQKVFSNIEFKLFPGVTLIIKGMNGSGKTSLLLSLAGIIPVTGNINWDEKISKIGYVGHKNAIKPSETVLEFIEFWKSLLKSSIETRNILIEFGLLNLQDFPCNLLSFGQKKILSFIRLLLSESKVWLLDEPLSGLDKKNKEFIIDLIKSHNHKGGTVIMTTHDDYLLKKKIEFKELIIDKNF